MIIFISQFLMTVLACAPEAVTSMQNLLNNSAKLEYSTLLEKKVGNVNVCRRIKLLYGEEYGMLLDSIIDSGTTVTVYFPLVPSFTNIITDKIS